MPTFASALGEVQTSQVRLSYWGKQIFHSKGLDCRNLYYDNKLK